MIFNEIIAQIDAKDPRGWESLFLRYGQKFYGFAVSNWKFTEDEAWEIVYHTLETIILKIGKYKVESQAHFDNLVYKIFLNFLRQSFRNKKRAQGNIQLLPIESDITVESKEFKVPFDSDFFNEYYDSEEMDNPKLKDLELALSKLDPLEKDLLLLKANEFTYEQIAEMLHIENNQLKVKHHRAKQKLFKILQTLNS